MSAWRLRCRKSRSVAFSVRAIAALYACAASLRAQTSKQVGADGVEQVVAVEVEAVDKGQRRVRSIATRAVPLGPRTARLVKLGVAIGALAEGAVRSHARRALAENMTPDEVRHVGLLALTTIGFPHTVAGLRWIDEVIASKG